MTDDQVNDYLNNVAEDDNWYDWEDWEDDVDDWEDDDDDWDDV